MGLRPDIMPDYPNTPGQTEKSLHDLLVHLYDPTYRPDDACLALTGCQTQPSLNCMRAAVTQAIEALHPTPEVPANARQWRLYHLLRERFVQGLTQEVTAEFLGLTTRHLRREEQEAVLLLAQHLRDTVSAAPSSAPVVPAAPSTPAAGDLPDWRAQVQQEVAALQKNAPLHVADVAAAMRSAAELSMTLAAQHNVQVIPHDGGIQAAGIRPPTLAAIHPSVLHQALVMAMGALLEHMAGGGTLTLGAGRAGGQIVVTLTGSPVPADAHPDIDPICAILTTQDCKIETQAAENGLALRLTLTPADQATVLVVDDNLDMVYLYRRYSTGTRFVIEHLADSQALFSRIETDQPDIVVLDVMLPDSDGWQLLSQLHASTNTRRIPVIICSVIKSEQLALALGACLYLPKPVSRNEFLAALERAAALALSPGAQQQL
jgi:two-component system cell cycle response regulator DivK